MYILVITLSVAFCSLSSAQFIDTTIALKGSYRLGQRYVAENAHTFKELIRRSSMFVDKTMLLKEILQDFRNRTISLNYPAKWGKSVNLNMIKTFLEIQVDKEGRRISPPGTATNSRLFKSGELILGEGMQVLDKPLMIAKHPEIVNKFLGQRPVVYLNFSALNGDAGFDKFSQEIADRISQSFAEHEYLKAVFARVVDDKTKPESERNSATENLKMYEKILSKKATADEILKSVNFLSSILTDYFKRRTYLLVDGYDAPFNQTFLNDALPRNQDQVFLKFYRQFMDYSVVSNVHVKKVILTGVIPLLKGSLFHPMPNSVEYTLLNDTNMHKYYGINKADMEQLFQLFETDGVTIKKIYQFFDGYNVGNQSRTHTLEPLSVIHMIHTEELIRSDGYFYRKYFAVQSIRQALQCLLSGLDLPIDLNSMTFDKEDFRNLQSVSHYDEKHDGPVLRAFLKYSLAVGYVTPTEFRFRRKFCIRLANGDISSTLRQDLDHYYINKFGPGAKVKEHSQRFYEEFVNFTRIENYPADKLKSVLESVYSQVANKNEQITHLVIDYLCGFLKSFERYPSYSTAVLLLDRGAGVIVDTTFNSDSADEALKNAIKSLLAFYPLRPVKMKYIGINVKPDSKVDIATE